MAHVQRDNFTVENHKMFCPLQTAVLPLAHYNSTRAYHIQTQRNLKWREKVPEFFGALGNVNTLKTNFMNVGPKLL